MLDVTTEEDRREIELGFNDVLDYSEFRSACDMGITFDAKDIDYDRYLRFKVIHGVVRKGNGKQ